MARVMLLMPHLPQRMGTPYLGQQYIAASLLRAGHEVRAWIWPRRFGPSRRRGRWRSPIERFAPDIIGMTLFTYNAGAAIALAQPPRSRRRGAPRRRGAARDRLP
jgi:hypothetical protein